MSLIYVDLRSRRPIFEQIVDSVRDLALRGLMQPDEHLPSVRALAAELAINPNTIQKAYGELERQGVIYSLAGRGNFISPDIARLADTHREELRLPGTSARRRNTACRVPPFRKRWRKR